MVDHTLEAVAGKSSYRGFVPIKSALFRERRPVRALFVLGGVLDGARFGVASGLALGLVVNLTAQAGDLLESRFKRRAQVKDSGTTFGPSGGMLDLVDSLLLSAPLVALLWPLLFELPT